MIFACSIKYPVIPLWINDSIVPCACNAIAATSAQRVQALPDSPTVIEAGYRFEVSNWHGLMGPKGMPPALVDKLNSEINRIVKDPEFAQRIAADGLIPAGGPPERLLKLLNEEIANWAKVAERAGLKVQ